MILGDEPIIPINSIIIFTTMYVIMYANTCITIPLLDVHNKWYILSYYLLLVNNFSMFKYFVCILNVLIGESHYIYNIPVSNSINVYLTMGKFNQLFILPVSWSMNPPDWV